MPWWILKQPNGTYARFSTVVDDFTHMNMTRDEALDVCRDYLGRRDADEKVRRADAEEPTDASAHRPVGVQPPPLTRWRECIDYMQALGKKRAARRRMISDEAARRSGRGREP